MTVVIARETIITATGADTVPVAFFSVIDPKAFVLFSNGEGARLLLQFLGMESPLITARAGLMTPADSNAWWDFDGEARRRFFIAFAISQRSGETKGTFMADFAVAMGGGFRQPAQVKAPKLARDAVSRLCRSFP